jgi:hypothetical protein
MTRSFYSFAIALFFSINLLANNGIKVSQKIPSSVKQGSEFQVDVVIEKKGVDGFAKLQFEGAAFTFKEQFVNFVWMSLPSDEVFTISYRISVSEKVFGNDSITGKFNYIQNNEKQTYIVPAEVVNIVITPSDASLATNNEKTTTETTPIETAIEKPNIVTDAVIPAETPISPIQPVVEEKKEVVAETIKPKEEPKIIESKPIATDNSKKEEPKANNPTASNTSSNRISSINPVAGVVFKIQLAALSAPPKEGTFSAFNDVSTFRAPDGLQKYYTGNYASYVEAQQSLSNVRGKGFETAFITAFKNGTPISVKEALGK